MTASEAKTLAKALLGFESYDTEPSALMEFIKDGERVIGQILMDANPWVFASSLVIPVTTDQREFTLDSTTYPSLSKSPQKILTTGQASSGDTEYQWLPALQPVEVMSKSPDAGGYNQPYATAWAYMPPTLRFSADIVSGYDLLVIHAELPDVVAADADSLFNGNIVASLYAYLVAYRAAILMGLQRGQDISGLAALHHADVERVKATIQEMQVQAMTHIPQFNGQGEP